MFLPYTGVKTDIIYATKVNRKIKTSEKEKSFWYFDVKSDGYTLDNHRRKLDTPSDLTKYEEYRKLDCDQASDMMKVGFEVIPLDKVRQNSCILVGSRYRANNTVATKDNWPIVKVGDLFEIVSDTINPADGSGRTLYIGLENIEPSTGRLIGELDCAINSIRSTKRVFHKSDILYGRLRPALNKVTYPNTEGICSTDIIVLRAKDTDSTLPELYSHILGSTYFNEMVLNGVSGGQLPRVDASYLLQLPIPQIPVVVQKKMIEELKGYQQVITGAQTVLNNYRPQLPVFTDVTTYSLSDTDLFEIISGGTPDSKNPNYWNGNINWITLADLPANDYITRIHESERKITEEGLAKSSAKLLPVESVVVSTRATIGRVGVNYIPLATNQGFKNIIIKDKTKILPEFLALLLREKAKEMESLASGATFKEISKTNFECIKISIPPLEQQKSALEQIKKEENLIEPSKHLVEMFRAKIQYRIKEVWGE